MSGMRQDSNPEYAVEHIILMKEFETVQGWSIFFGAKTVSPCCHLLVKNFGHPSFFP